MWRALLGGARQRWPHLLACLASVVAGMSFVVAALCLCGMVGAAEEGFSALADDLTVLPDPGALREESPATAPTLPGPLAAEVGRLPGVTRVTPFVLATDLVLVGEDGRPLNPATQAVLAASFDASAALAEGSAPAAGHVVLDRRTLEASGLEVGRLMVFARPGAEAFTATISGVLGGDPGTATALFSAADASTVLLGATGASNGLRVQLAADVDASEVAATLAALLPRGFEVTPRSGLSWAVRHHLHPELGIGGIVVWSALALACLGALALMASAQSRHAAARQEEVARLRRLGASPGQVRGPWLAEACGVGLVGTALAVPVGLLLARWWAGVAAAHGFSLGTEPHLSRWGWLALTVLGPLLSAIAGLVQVRKLTRGCVQAQVRLPTAPRTRPSDVTWSGLGLGIVGVAGLVVLTLVPSLPLRAVWGWATAAALVLGAVVAAPLLGMPMTVALGRLARPLVGREVALCSTRSITRRPDRLAKAATALALGTALLAATAVLGASGRASVAADLPGAVHGDLFVTTDAGRGLAPTAAKAAAGVPGVSEVHAVGRETAWHAGRPRGFDVAAPGEYQKVFSVTVAGREPLHRGEVLVRADHAQDRGIRRGDRISTVINRRPVNLTVVGTFTVPGADVGEFWTLRETFTALGVPARDNVLALRTDAADAVAPALSAALGAHHPLAEVRTIHQLEQTRADQLTATAELARALLILVVVGSVLGLTSLLLVSVGDRSRELRTAQLAGFDRDDLVRMVLLEGVQVGVVGAVLGTVAGALAGWALQLGLAGRDFHTLALPWPVLVTLPLLGLLVGGLAGIPPALHVRHRTGGVGSPHHTGERQPGAESADTADPRT